jgi:hypothetical protein
MVKMIASTVDFRFFFSNYSSQTLAHRNAGYGLSTSAPEKIHKEEIGFTLEALAGSNHIRNHGSGCRSPRKEDNAHLDDKK